MDFSVSFIVAPLVGGIIGYITNDIAIRMLFRPHTAKYIVGIRIPFTPGIIPKERSRIAEALGSSISTNLMNKEVLEKSLLSDEMLLKMTEALDSFFEEQKENPETLFCFMNHYLSTEEIMLLRVSCNEELTNLIHDRLTDPFIGKQIAHTAIEKVQEKLSGLESIVSAVTAPVESLLANCINEILKKNSKELIGTLLFNETEKVIDLPISQLLWGKEKQIEQIKHSLVSFYRVIISEHLPKILETVDISRIVSDRVKEMNTDETEKLIFQVMNKELKAIVWLGALLGCIMGVINCFI